MTSLEPPRIAAWFLKRFATSDALVGDLSEDFERRRSPMWYRRQVLSVMFTSVAHELRTHRSEVSKTVLLSWGAMTLVNVILAPMRDWIASQYLGMSIVFFASIAVGWLMTKLQPAIRGSVVCLCAISFVFLGLPQIFRLTIDSFEHARFAGYLRDALLWVSVVPLGVVIGGLVSIRPMTTGTFRPRGGRMNTPREAAGGRRL